MFVQDRLNGTSLLRIASDLNQPLEAQGERDAGRGTGYLVSAQDSTVAVHVLSSTRAAPTVATAARFAQSPFQIAASNRSKHQNILKLETNSVLKEKPDRRKLRPLLPSLGLKRIHVYYLQFAFYIN